MSGYQPDLPATPERRDSERKVEEVRERGGIFVEAVRATRTPMLVADATLPGNPVIFANEAFLALSGYAVDEVLGQDPHFLDGPHTDPETIARFRNAMAEGRDETLDVLQYRKDGSTFWAALFVAPWRDEQGRVAHHFVSFLDITRRREAETALQRLVADLEREVAERTGDLATANIRLERLLAEKETLLVEVNHRAKNSLTVASSLLAVQARLQANLAVKALLHEAEARLYTMARVHDLLSHSEDVQKIALSGYLRDLCASLMSLTDGRIRVVVEADEGILLDTARAVSLGLMVNELITNAVKHAFPPPQAGTVAVTARRTPESWVKLSIRDDGVGASAEWEEGLGYEIVRSLVEQVGGEMDIDRDDGHAVTVTFPL